MSKEILKQLNKLYKHVEYWNKMGPFPRYDTEWQSDIKNYLNDVVTLALAQIASEIT